VLDGVVQLGSELGDPQQVPALVYVIAALVLTE
jgi:hypothetical protein